MPLIKLTTNVDLNDAAKADLGKACSSLLAKCTGKPEKYAMIVIGRDAITMAGTPGPAAYADVRGIGGLSPDVNRLITKDLCELLKTRLGIAPDRVYANFTEIAASNWGFNGSTFG